MIIVKHKEKGIKRTLVDNGYTLNVCSLYLLDRIGIYTLNVCSRLKDLIMLESNLLA